MCIGLTTACLLVSRAQAAGPWSYAACCAVKCNADRRICRNLTRAPPDCWCNDCSLDYCFDRHAASDFLFRLQPGEPQRFLPSGDGVDYHMAARAGADGVGWPQWGGGPDLTMGYNDSPGGWGGWCDQGDTYAGSPNEACGGQPPNWGRTEVEAWFLAEGV